MSAGPSVTNEFESLAAVICDRLAKNKRVRRNLPGAGRVRIDRQLPFLCIYRSPTDREDVGTRELVTTEAAYLFASGEPAYHDGLRSLCHSITTTMQEHFDAFLLVEIWADEADGEEIEASLLPSPSFRIVTPEVDSLPSMVGTLEAALSKIEVVGRTANVSVTPAEQVAPPGLKPVLHSASGCFVLGLAVRPVYRDAATGALFPIVLQRLRRQLAAVIRQAVFAFTDTGIDADAHFESLGPTALTRAAREADLQLCEIASSFDFLLQVTPVNSRNAWEEFRDGGYAREPSFQYRPLPYHPNLIKRKLYEVPVERIEDATLSHLCWEKQNELDRQLTALRDLGTSEFLYDSLLLYGPVEDWLVELAAAILDRFPGGAARDAPEYVCVDEVTARARQEIAYYRKRMPDFEAAAVVRDDVAAGMMVAQSRLFVSENVRLRRDRIEPLMHHEIGTHLLTYFNGRRQPFGLLSAGLAGYEPLQEGLAILAECLVGGLTASRWRTLAARVIAVDAMTDGADFVEVFDRLHRELRFEARSAFMTTLRVFRGGGLTKDAIYLRGFHSLLAYLAGGHDVEPLYVGKMGLQHVPYVRELRRRGALGPPGSLPRLWNDEGLRDRLETCRNMTLLELAEQSS